MVIVDNYKFFRLKKLGLIFFITIVLFACSDREESNEVTIVLSSSADSVLRDTVFQNIVIDSLKKVALASKTDTSFLKNLCILSQNFSSQNRFVLSKEIIEKSEKIGYTHGKYRGKVLLATYTLGVQKYSEADSMLKSIIVDVKKIKDDYCLASAK